LPPHSYSPPAVAPRTPPLSLHDALPISKPRRHVRESLVRVPPAGLRSGPFSGSRRPLYVRLHGPIISGRLGTWGPRVSHLILLRDRKSTRLNSSHGSISYAVFCLKKKK